MAKGLSRRSGVRQPGGRFKVIKLAGFSGLQVRLQRILRITHGVWESLSNSGSCLRQLVERNAGIDVVRHMYKNIVKPEIVDDAWSVKNSG